MQFFRITKLETPYTSMKTRREFQARTLAIRALGGLEQTPLAQSRRVTLPSGSDCIPDT